MRLDLIEYLQEENRVLKERLGDRRLRFTDAERCRLARKAQSLGRKVLNEIETLVTPSATELRVTLCRLSSVHRSQAVAALCETLNRSGTCFPGTRLRMHFAVAGSPK